VSRTRCPTCGARLRRAHRRGWIELVLGALGTFIRPFQCSQCGFRGLRLASSGDRRSLLRFAIVVLLSLILVQLVWFVRTHAPEHSGGGYQPRDIERQRQLEEAGRR
jgi:hypothetical protein